MGHSSRDPTGAPPVSSEWQQEANVPTDSPILDSRRLEDIDAGSVLLGRGGGHVLGHFHPLMTTVDHLLMANSSKIMHHFKKLRSSQTGLWNMTKS